MEIKEQTGLILTGAGVRAACQVGVLPARSHILWAQRWAPARNRFDIICGSSAGAINATALACRVLRSRIGAHAPPARAATMLAFFGA